MLFLSTLLMHLKIGHTECKRATDVSSSLDVLCTRWIENIMELLVTVAILFKCTMKKFQFSWDTFLVTYGSGCMYQG